MTIDLRLQQAPKYVRRGVRHSGYRLVDKIGDTGGWNDLMVVFMAMEHGKFRKQAS